jgi:hypothetical protein
MKRLFYLSILVFTIHLNLFSQADSTSNKVKYYTGFKFNEGFYLNFEQIKNNQPVPKSRIISTTAYDDPDFFDKELTKNKIYYFDNLGNKDELAPNSIWGYSRNGALYIKMEDGFYKITMIGSICHFVATHTTYSNTYASPYYYNPYMDPYGTGPSSYPTSEMRQYILDFATGRVLDYTVEGIEVVLMSDAELHDEYMALNKKKQKQMMFVYIRKFNERNPLYFPVN